MNRLTRLGVPAIVLVALSVWCLLQGQGNAGEGKKLMKEVDEVASLLAKGEEAKAKDLAKKIAKSQEDDIYYTMLLMKPRNRKGFGVGDKEGEIVPDGMELKIRYMSRDILSAAKLKKEADALVEMAHRVAAIAHISDHINPAEKKAEWSKYSKEMVSLSNELIKAVKSGSTAEVKKAATALNTNCNNCHSIFR